MTHTPKHPDAAPVAWRYRDHTGEWVEATKETALRRHFEEGCAIDAYAAAPAEQPQDWTDEEIDRMRHLLPVTHRGALVSRSELRTVLALAVVKAGSVTNDELSQAAQHVVERWWADDLTKKDICNLDAAINATRGAKP